MNDLPDTLDSAAPGLAALRDLHVPEPIGPWPIAPGWWGLAIAATVITVLVIRLWRRRRPAIRAGLRELDRLERALTSGACTRQTAMHVSIVLRAAALDTYPRDDVAGLAGESWLAFLNRSAGRDLFAGDAARALLEIPYAADATRAEASVQALVGAARQWLVGSAAVQHRSTR